MVFLIEIRLKMDQIGLNIDQKGLKIHTGLTLVFFFTNNAGFWLNLLLWNWTLRGGAMGPREVRHGPRRVPSFGTIH